MKDFNGKIAFITGGASGAGLGQAKVFSEAGMKVVIADVRQDHLDEASAYFAEKGAPVHTIKLDVTDRAAFAAAADETERVFGGPPDLLFLTAGVNVFGPAEASTYDDYDWVLGVCLGGVINGFVTFVPRMIKAGKGGHIAAVASWGAFEAGPVTAPYTAAKAAVLNLTESYYVALKPYGIGVTVVCPANINSRIWEAATVTRPENLRNTGYNANEDTQAFLATIHQHGMDPVVLAKWLKDSIEAEQYLCVPYSAREIMVAEAVQRFVDYTTLEGIQRREERLKQAPTEEQRRIIEEREGGAIINEKPEVKDVGFGKARADVDWVDPSKKAGG
jgi:NAD(P)-dependent dehydrogenase (short-subunit alcohol dehydrogenase family)